MRKDATGNSGTTFCSPAVRENPILFSGAMVRAILQGRKTQTRRMIKPQPITWHHEEREFEFLRTEEHRPVFADTFAKIYSPYGQPDDFLWVRETWKTGCNLDKYSPKQIREKFEDGKCCPMFYVADGEHKRWGNHDIADFGDWGKTRVSIHMPRWASRITLEIVDVRIEQLQSISNADIAAEGIEPIGDERSVGSDGQFAQAGRLENRYSTMRQLWSELWESINGAGSWSANPWVWVVEFKRV